MPKSDLERFAEANARQGFGDTLASVHWAVWLLAFLLTVAVIVYILESKPYRGVYYEHLLVVEDESDKPVGKLIEMEREPSTRTLAFRALAVSWLVLLCLFFAWVCLVAGGFGIH